MTNATIRSTFHPVSCRLHGHGWIPFIVLGALMAAALPAFADGPPIPGYSTLTDYQIAQHVAPHLYFDPGEHNWPVTIDWFFAHTSLKNKNGTDYGPATNLDHVLTVTGASSGDYYLDIPTTVENGDPILNGDPNMSHFRPYVKVINHPYLITSLDNGQPFVFATPYKEVQFWFLYAYNGCQTHRLQALDLGGYHTSHFQMCDGARHQGDLEAVAVYINNSTGRPMGVGQSRHGAVVYTAWDRLTANGTHPDIYPAWASHANYFSNGYHGLAPDMSGTAGLFCGILNVNYWRVVDLRAQGGQEWDPALYKQNLVLLDTTRSDRGTAETSPYTKYLGAWGRWVMSGRTVRLPAAHGFDTNNGVDVVTAVSDSRVSSCFDTLIQVGEFAYDFTGGLGKNPIYSFGPEGIDTKEFVDHAPGWFSTKPWTVGMVPEAVD